MEYKITKIQLIRTACPGGLREWYYLANVRVYPDGKRDCFWRRRFVFMIDANEVADEYPEAPRITQKMMNDYKQEVAWATGEALIRSNKNIEDVTSECNATITRYNDTYGYCA